MAFLENCWVFVQGEEKDGGAGDDGGDQDAGDVESEDERVGYEREEGVVGEAQKASEDNEVDVGDDGSENGGEDTVEAQGGGDDKVVEEGLEATLSEEKVGGAGGADHGDAVERDKGVCVEVEVADPHAEQVHAEVAHVAKEAVAVDHEEDGDALKEHDKERAEADGAEAVGERPLERTGALSGRHALEGALQVVPGAVDAADGDVHDVSQHVGDVQPREVEEEDRDHQLRGDNRGGVAVVVETHRAVAVEAKGDVCAADGKRQDADEEGAAQEADQRSHGRARVPLHHGDDDVQDRRRERHERAVLHEDDHAGDSNCDENNRLHVLSDKEAGHARDGEEEDHHFQAHRREFGRVFPGKKKDQQRHSKRDHADEKD